MDVLCSPTFSACDALVDGDRQLDGELVGQRFDLDHYIPNQGADAGVAHHLYQRSAGEGADGIEGDVAQQWRFLQRPFC